MADHGRDSGSEGAQVVSLAALAEDTRFPALTELEEYWRDLKGERLLPARSEVDPRRIENALEYAFVLERIAPGMARFRLAGMHLNELMGMEVRGMPLTTFFAPEARKRVSAALEQVFDAPAVARLSLSGETGIGRPSMEARMLLLPLKSDFGDVSRAIGCLSTLGAVGRTPRRFSIFSETVQGIAGPAHEGDRRIGGWSRPRRVAAGTGDEAARIKSPEGSDAPSVTTPGEREAPPRAGFYEPGAPANGGRVASPAGRSSRAQERPRLYLVKSDED